jgi:hypothetical protein
LPSVCQNRSDAEEDDYSVRGFLVHKEDVENGSLFLKWSESTVSRALAILIPGETMPPRYKLTYQDGEEFLIRPANLGVHKAKYWEGFVMLARRAKQMDAAVKLLDHRIGMWSQRPNGEVRAFTHGIPEACAPLSAVACGSKDSTALKGVQVLSASAFLSLSGTVCVQKLG